MTEEKLNNYLLLFIHRCTDELHLVFIAEESIY